MVREYFVWLCMLNKYLVLFTGENPHRQTLVLGKFPPENSDISIIYYL